MGTVVRTQLDANLARLAEGDRSAFDPVFTALWPAVLGLSVRLVGSADAEDVAARALGKVFERADEYDRTRPALAWVFGIAAWECRATLTRRRRRREEELGPCAELASEAPSPEDQAALAQLIEAAEAVLGELSPADQATLRATFAESPDATGATFRKRRSRALERLRMAWRRIHGTF